MEKITITLDLTKLDKSRIEERTYTNKEGQEVTVKEYKMDVVPLKPEQQKHLAEGDTWEMKKTHFVVNSPTKQERQDKVKTGTVGEGIMILNKTAENPPQGASEYPDGGGIDPNDLAF